MNLKLLVKTMLAVVIVALVVLSIATPVLATQDDTFAQYVLSSGFTQATLHVTYFEFGLIGYENIFASLYHHFPNFNCVTSFYLILHVISATIIVYHFARQKKFLFSIVYLFFFFGPLIINLSFTTVSAHAIIAGFLICLSLIQEQRIPSYLSVLLLSCWFVIALLLRIHIVFPLLLIFFPFFFLIKNKEILKRLFVMIFLTALVTVSAFVWHQKYYRLEIKDWKYINATTNAFYELGNKGYDMSRIDKEFDPQKHLDYKMIKNGFLYDDNLLNAETLNGMQEATSYQSVWHNLNGESLYFLFTDTKQYLLILTMMIVLLVVLDTKKIYRNLCLMSLAIALAISFYLLVFMRLPERVWFTFFLLLFLVISFALPPIQQIKFTRFQTLLFSVLATGVLVIQGVYFFKTNSNNIENVKCFERAALFVSNHPDTLFVEYHESFPFNSFPAFASPREYPIENVLFPFFFNTELRNNLLKKFHVQSVSNAITSSNNVVLIGTPDEDLESYLEFTQRKKIVFRKIFAKESCLNLFSVTTK